VLKYTKITKLLSKTLIFIGAKANGACRRIALKIYTPNPTLKDIGWENFIRSGGEQLRIDYILNEKSIVFDIGGFDGQFSSDFFSIYLCKIYIFEAYKPFAIQIENRFRQNQNVQVFDFGLASEDGEMEISVDSVASSTFKKTKQIATIQLKKASKFLDQIGISHIDLMKINIEGGEYDLLYHLISSNKVQMIKNIQVQFHDFVPDATRKMLEIRELLMQSHKPTYLCDFIWENWERK
jgi:FkbM family methyltransferase